MTGLCPISAHALKNVITRGIGSASDWRSSFDQVSRNIRLVRENCVNQSGSKHWAKSL